jgi:putative ABC transport system substrate-binding protein
MKRREFIALVGGAVVARPLAALAQQAPMPVIGFLNSASSDAYPDRVDAFRKGLFDTGYVEGRNIEIEYRWADGHNERLPQLAADLVSHAVTVIAAVGGPTSALAAKAATTAIPIVFQVGIDPVALGLVASLARPGGNITGITSLNVDVGSKRLELLHGLVPEAKVVVLLVNPTNPANAANDAKDAQKAASNLGLRLHVLEATSDQDFENIFATLLQMRAGGLLLGTDVLFTSHKEKLIAFTLGNSVPSISPYREYARAGGLMSYGGDILNSWRLAGAYTGRVLKGERPADLPVQQATKVELVVNLNTAKTLGLTVPQTLLVAADEVIE